MLALAMAGACVTASTALAQQNVALDYARSDRSQVPLPASEKALQTVVAEPWLKVSDGRMQLEGPSFDRSGNLLMVDVFGGAVLKVAPDGTISTLYRKEGLNPAGLAIHRDGRLFIAGLGNFIDSGSIVAINADRRGEKVILPPSRGMLPDDIEFDSDGGFYFTDFRGTSNDLAGGVYYMAPDMATVTPVLPRMAIANGVALSPDGKTLWATEFSANRLHRVSLSKPAEVAHFGTSVPYYFTGGFPDSMRTDSDGNVYVAMYMQGRVLVFNPAGLPIGQILLPGRDEGHNLHSTSLAIKPGTNDLYIVTNDGDGGAEGSQIFHARGFAKAKVDFAHR